MAGQFDYGLKTFSASDNVFYRDYTPKVRMEVSLSVSEKFKKFKILMQELESIDKQGIKKRQKASIEIYVDCDKFMGEFIHFCKNGRYGKLGQMDLGNAIKALKDEKTNQPMIFFMTNGGTMPHKLKEGKSRNGNAEYRELKLRRSTVHDSKLRSKDPSEYKKATTVKFLLTAMACDGKVLSQGNGRSLIIPLKDKSGKIQNATTINFMLTYEQLMAMAYACERELAAYRQSQYVVAELIRNLKTLAGGIHSTPSNIIEEPDDDSLVPQVDYDEETGEVYYKDEW